LRGISTLTGFALAVEIGDWSRFDGNSIGAYVGLIPSEPPDMLPLPYKSLEVCSNPIRVYGFPASTHGQGVDTARDCLGCCQQAARR